MPWKQKSDGSLDTKDGNPVWIEDEEEMVVEAAETLTKISALNIENQKLKEAVQKNDSIKVNLEKKIENLETELGEQNQAFQRIILQSGFDRSDFLKETIFDPMRDRAFQAFEDNFRFNDQMTPVGYYDAERKKPVYSLREPGEYAGIDEALELIIARHPQSEHFMKEKKQPKKFDGKIDAGDKALFSANVDAIAKGQIQAAV